MQNLVRNRTDKVINTAVSWAVENGIMNISKQIDKFNHVPITLHPFPFSNNAFNYTLILARTINTLIYRISRDIRWLEKIHSEVIVTDAFTRTLMNIAQEADNTNRVGSAITMSHIRSDYMMNTDTDRPILQVEMNTISASFASLASKVSQMHVYLADDATTNIPPNDSLDALVDGLFTAHNAYVANYSCIVSPIILMVVGRLETNIIDQRAIEFMLQARHKTRMIRVTFDELFDGYSVDDDGRFLFCGQEVSIVYYRTGYVPDDYIKNEDWEIRQKIEFSRAVKCPTVACQLAGTKKTQQVLSQPDEVERFIGDCEESRLLRKVFARQYSLGCEAHENKLDLIQDAISHSSKYVIKPQREGGGNNLYDDELATFLRTTSSQEQAAYVLMEKIQPPSYNATLIRECHGIDCLSVAELGIYGVHVTRQGQDVMNRNAGYLLRVKASSSNEGGVAAGYAQLSTPNLILS